MKNKKLLILAATAAMTVALVGTVVAVSQSNGLLESRANESVTGSIVFSRSGGSTFTKIDDRTASVSGRTSNGATYYAVSRNFEDISSGNNVAKFGFDPYDPSCPTSDKQYVTFSTGATDISDFEFQSITGIKVTSTSATDQTLHVYYSADGVTFCVDADAIQVFASSNPQKTTFSTPYKYVRLGTQSGQTRNITAIELFYSCGEQPEPVKTLESIKALSPKTRYAVNSSFVEPSVEAAYSNGDKEIVSGATFSGYSMSSLGEQTVTVTYGGKTDTFEISVRPTETSKKISYEGFNVGTMEDTEASEFMDLENSTLVYYAESGNTVEIVPVFKSKVSYLGVDEKLGYIEEFTEDEGTISFTMCNYYDAVIVFSYYVEPSMVSIRVDKPQTVYYVGDQFVEPKVYGVYDNGAEEKLTSGVTFSGFNSSAIVAQQTITASFNEGEFTTQYTIEIKDASEKPHYDPSLLNGAYTTPQGSNTMELAFDGLGSGTYTYINAYNTRKYVINFTYTVNSDSREVVITLDENTSKSNITGYSSGGFRIVNPNDDVENWVNDSGILESNGSLTITMWRLSAGTYYQDQVQNFSK